MAPRADNAAEAEIAIHRLLDRMQAWLLQQPETMLIWTQPRQVRKRFAEALAKEVATIPVREPSEIPNRKMRKAILKALEAQEREWYRGIDL